VPDSEDAGAFGGEHHIPGYHSACGNTRFTELVFQLPVFEETNHPAKEPDIVI